MEKELIALETWYLVKKHLNKIHHQIVRENIEVKTIEGHPISIIEDSLKALEIIKNNIRYLDDYLFEFKGRYYIFNYDHEITKEEYELLKEVLL